ncbi:RbsD or FucU transport [Shewanella halifaxensis HAW-EB4]|uniref:D-ribose pyranase n=1 Tax=Shewanella halifaxensis (strain HAW-EB4) TaxID=458817 RepID=RBSD_SHEHH|nr:D-ribose pyranase [Shewanella halifaxensis]B0TS18.1 RecName: Full=D-ribose pyranase [Shewanella halifaxensis HAW-EB4]ABZ75153.1 RbsD or FucU transport [Shewanella halifaxensis HAW-EB4]
MNKHALLNADMNYLVATLGHTDEVAICDAGLPIPAAVQRIDLALTHGVPSFIATVKIWLASSQIEGVVLAQEFADVSPECHQALLVEIEAEQLATGRTFSIEYVSHEAFKQRTHNSRAVIRTGECTPYANVIFKTGVVF